MIKAIVWGGDYTDNLEDIINEEVITLGQAIGLIRESIKNKKEKEIFYDELAHNAIDPKESGIIAGISRDERRHYEILRGLYYKFTGIVLPHYISFFNEYINLSYKEQLEKALFIETDAIKRYRRIMGAMPDNESYILLMSIMTDGIRHADLFNFLIVSQK